MILQKNLRANTRPATRITGSTGPARNGIAVQQQPPIHVYDQNGTSIGDDIAELLMEGWLIPELKTAKTIAPGHEAHILDYLKSARLKRGMLIDLGP